ncbi:transglutaminase family protein [Candidatus Methylobacter oryzae]|uniref:Transglutaminase family protein n=1 Tax=Candidatus Methylobacter oryzae TaxID=2497749 RepID=A0ABY3C6F3_9GAMM|nr:transglutaminase family protein [Candidatus Methylobacter oryzae]TRW90675.1 transglutaminase family protein [Candidatus Methylobacter oryzae]
MKYRITHSTLYEYHQLVGLCQNEARLQPRDFWRQRCQSSRFEISPEPSDFSEREDFFGNRVAYFAIQQAHQRLMVTVVSEVETFPKQSRDDLANSITWEQAREQLQGNPGQAQNVCDELLDAKLFLLDSPMVVATDELAAYARNSFLPNRPLVQAVTDLMQRIHNDFTYDSSSTTIATPLSEVLQFRRGVCQDFAHLAIGCLRSFGIAARYVSGYLETLPLPGKQRLVGADASHAWFAVYVPDAGWLEFDPTNNAVPFDQHITLAWGRDYADVTPLKGIAFGGGQHTLSVSVDVLRLE